MEFIFSLLLGVTGNLNHNERLALNESLSAVQKIYSELPMDELVEKYYFVAVHTDQSEIEQALLNSQCLENSEFRPVEVNQVTQIWFVQIQKAAKLVFEGRKMQSYLTRADRSLLQFQTILKNTELEICESPQDEYYSDGGTQYYIRTRDGLPVVMFEEGYPD